MRRTSPAGLARRVDTNSTVVRSRSTAPPAIVRQDSADTRQSSAGHVAGIGQPRGEGARHA
jgi:hypothetical protein